MLTTLLKNSNDTEKNVERLKTDPNVGLVVQLKIPAVLSIIETLINNISSNIQLILTAGTEILLAKEI